MARGRCHQAAGLALLVAACALPAHGQDLLQVWHKALQRDPAYAASGAARAADQELIPQARALLLPYISADATGEAIDRRRTSTLRNRQSDSRAYWALTLTQPIFDAGAWSALDRAKSLAHASEVAQADAYQDLILRVAQAYFDILAAQDNLRALLAEKNAVETQLQAARQSFELGSTTITDTYEAQARLDLIKANELLARNALQVSQDALARIISERPGTLAALAPDAQLPPPVPNRLDAWTQQSATANLDVLQADLAARAVQAQMDIAKSGHYPTVSLQAQTGSASDNGLYTNGNGPRSLDSSVGLQISIPIFAGGGISSAVREQASRLQQARYQLEDAKREAVQATQRYFSGVTSGLARIHALQEAEASSRSSLQANRTGYEVGVRISIDVLNAQQQLYETQRNLAQARYDTLMDSLRLKAASGSLTDADLVAINALLADDPAAASVQTVSTDQHAGKSTAPGSSGMPADTTQPALSADITPSARLQVPPSILKVGGRRAVVGRLPGLNP
ncbi:hypothetical protein ERD78_10595 [Allopusillimonas soli]|uniref:TolC family outer membrane protein n=1 Tax=Allopusillimonas soli TaxID=659016 RepID=A0A853FGM3_9BURK|nr:TolC family outer membrane protein [Allopusillimonas soli]NYT37601.1 TolC family outer membrane protein [Allopusillimonas soli]TEA74436.1 hypothetical protein ERD78_10595 [Allopusillimonas soli]